MNHHHQTHHNPRRMVVTSPAPGAQDVPGCGGHHIYHVVVEFARVSVDHRVMGGVPCIRGTRIPVATVVGSLAEGMTADDLVREFPQLALEDVAEALRYAAAAVDERQLPLRPTA